MSKTKMTNQYLPKIKGLISSAIDFFHFFDEIPVGIAILDKDFNVVRLNSAFEAISGFFTDEAHGIPCRHIVRSSACVHKCPALKVSADSQPVSFESDIINKNRELLPVRITIAPLLDESGSVSGYIEAIEDLRSVKSKDIKKSQAYSFQDIIGRSPQMEKIFQTLPVLAQSDSSILITGETGTGKDLVAEAIHQTSGRSGGPFIKVNCGALPETLLESELFGHQRGAFTGAVENKPGRFRLAHNGTIFLTEIGDLPLSLQVKLLTFLDDKIIYPLGSTKGFKANVRMVAATHRNLEQMVIEGNFRQDLMFRLNVARIHLPPLRKREGDIRLLLDYFLNAFSADLNKDINGFSAEAIMILQKYDYSGNIRELRNIVEYAVNIANSNLIEAENLPAYLLDMDQPRFQVTETETLEFSPDPPDHFDVPVRRTNNNVSGKEGTWASAEREMIMDALISAKGKKGKAAEILGWGRSTLWRKMKQYGIDS